MNDRNDDGHSSIAKVYRPVDRHTCPQCSGAGSYTVRAAGVAHPVRVGCDDCGRSGQIGRIKPGVVVQPASR